MSKRQASQPVLPRSAKRPGRSPAPETTAAAASSSEMIATPSTELAHKPSSELENESWKSLAREISQHGAIVVTDHDQPVAVMLSVEVYEALARLARREQARVAQKIAELNARVDQRIALLNTPDARRALDAFMDEPVVLNGEVRAGTSC